jgi:hypothetical protein
MEMAINLSILALVLPVLYAGALALEETHAVALWHLQTADEVRTLAEALHRDARWGQPLPGDPLAWTRGGCTARYRLEAGTLSREQEGTCEGRQALATGVAAFRAEAGGITLEKDLALRPGRTQHDRVFLPLEAP